MIEIKEGEPFKKKGVWRGTKMRDGRRSALMSCPKCGQTCSLSHHKIQDNGEVQPSVVCPMDCGFHEYVKLAGWSKG